MTSAERAHVGGADGRSTTGSAVAAWFSFTEVFDGHHLAFDRWHALDHMPEQFGIDEVRYARRWTVDPELVAGGDDHDLANTHHVHMYLFAPPVDRGLREMTVLAELLAAQGRWFNARKGLLYAPFRVTGAWTSPVTQVRAAVLPYRPDRGAHVVVTSSRDTALIAARLVQLPGVAGCWTFESLPAEGLPSGTPAAPSGTGIVLAWLDEEPSPSAPLHVCFDAAPVRFARTLRPAQAYPARRASPLT